MAEKDLTIRELSKVSGISSSTIDGWRNGATPADYLAVLKVARVLGVSFTFLLTGETEAMDGNLPNPITSAFDEGEPFFDGYAKIRIQRLIPRHKNSNRS